MGEKKSLHTEVNGIYEEIISSSYFQMSRSVTQTAIFQHTKFILDGTLSRICLHLERTRDFAVSNFLKSHEYNSPQR